MRTQTILNKALFAKQGEEFAAVTLPHTWNNLDGQDGGSDYWRGHGIYKLQLPAPTAGKRQYIQFDGANHVATVSCNGKELGTHKGGFSTFRFDLTDVLKADGNELVVDVTNEECDVYPQQADFTFFGGLYRNVSFIEAEPAHFDLMKCGTNGVFVTPHAAGKTRIDAFPVNADGCLVQCVLKDAEGNEVARETAAAEEHTVVVLDVENPHLWNGLPDPYLYTAHVSLLKDGEVSDEIVVNYGYRGFHVDPENGFFLNGKSYPLHGVARHQDRLDMGWAISEAEHAEDVALIKEVGANTIRLAHYQHAQPFYDLCDKNGLVLWAEIPFISVFREGEDAKANTLSQMTELISQNYNHPSIFFWGISNEITIAGESEALYQNLCELNALAKKLDPSRLTTMAQVSMVPMDSEHVYITDVQSYNHYFGWYVGDVSENGPWLDEFHRKNPDRPVGVSEYGAEAILTWHTAKPESHDYTEEYQAYYHHEMLKTFATRPYLWSTHVWNMFDFAADARDEGGCKGRNNKGLVTYDRKIKKDAFFIYKAYWTTEPMVHVCGSRFVDRAPGQRDVIVYTNCPEVTLFVNGAEVGTQQAVDHMCVFHEVALQNGANTVTAKAAGAPDDTISLNGVDKPNESYVLPQEETEAGNWFDELGNEVKMEFPEGYLSIKEKLGTIMANEEGAKVLMELFEKLGAGSGMGKSMKNMMGMIKGMTLENILTLMGNKVPANATGYINSLLTKIKK